MRNPPRIWRGGSKVAPRTVNLEPPKCFEVPVEVLGVSPGLQRFDIIAPEELPENCAVAVPVPGVSPDLERFDVIASTDPVL